MARTKVSSMSVVIVLRMPVRKDYVSTLKIQQGDGLGNIFLDFLSLDKLVPQAILFCVWETKPPAPLIQQSHRS